MTVAKARNIKFAANSTWLDEANDDRWNQHEKPGNLEVLLYVLR